MSNKKTIFVLGDHPLSTSGVGTSIRYFIESMLKTGKYKFIVFGGATRIQNETPITIDPWGEDYVIFPVEGFGTQQKVREAIGLYKPDILWFMTDPRFWTWLWEIDQEIRVNVPMLYFHVWDNYPAPMFNRPFYLANDMIVTMSQVSSNIVKEVVPEVDEVYVPLAADTEIFKPLPEAQWIGAKPHKDRTLFFWNNRNARRKQSGTIIWWFKEFLDKVGHDKAQLLMHTDPKDENGQDLIAIAEKVGLTRDEFIISPGKVTQEQLAIYYNMADCIINVSDAEGVGMGTIESLSCETPIIVNMTGGLQEQVTDGQEWFGIPIYPCSKTIIGNQEVPYIYEDRISREDFIAALEKMHNLTREQRKEMGRKGREYVLNKYSLQKYAQSWEKILDAFIEKYGSWENRKNYIGLTIKEF